MALSLSTDAWSVMLTALRDLIDSAATPGKIQFFDGSRPANAGTPTNLQAEIVLAQPSGTVSSGVLTYTLGTEGQRIDDKTITWCRFLNGDGVIVADGNVGVSGGGADVSISNIDGFIGGFVRMTSGTFGAP